MPSSRAVSGLMWSWCSPTPGLPGAAPGGAAVAHGARVRVERVPGDAVVLRSDQRVGGDDDVGQVRRRLGALAVDHEVLAVLERLGDVAVAVEPARVGEGGQGLR